MIFCGKWPVGICSWSLDNDLAQLNKLREKVGIDRVHLALDPAIKDFKTGYLHDFIQDGWNISATMTGFEQEDYSTLESIKRTGGIVPDEYWSGNRAAVFKAVEATASLNVKYLEFHFGFIDITDTIYAAKLAARAKELAKAADKNGVTILMETGQETARTLLDFLKMVDHASLAVNFDPANMILYGKGDPVEAVEMLGPWIKHVHIKDALSSHVAGRWGKEVAWGTGAVGADAFLKALKRTDFVGTLSIEREAGTSRVADIESAVVKLNNAGQNL